MRTKTLASLLILCGSTAAIAQVATPPAQEQTMDNTAVDDAMANQTTPTDPTTPDAMSNETTTEEPATDTPAPDAETPGETATPPQG